MKTTLLPAAEASTPAFIRALARRHGDRELIVLGERRLSYAKSERESATLAKQLLAIGVGKGTRVGLLLPNGPDFVLFWLAAARVGAVVVPVNTFSKPSELGHVLRHADLQILFTVSRFLNNDYLQRLEAFSPSLTGADAACLCVPELPYLRSVFVLGDSDRKWTRSLSDLAAQAGNRIDERMLEAVEAQVTAADPMMLIYSSGSTSAPKGAIHSHGAVIRHSLNLADTVGGIDESDRCYSPMPFFWVGGLVFTLCRLMHKGACFVAETAFDPGSTLEMLEREHVTNVAGWPHYGKAMLEHPSFARRDLSQLRAGNIYAILPNSVRPRDPELRSTALGMTETCGPHSAARMDVDLPESLRGAFGRALDGIETRIVDPETGVPLPPMQIGELCVRGYSLMQGFHKVERERTFDADGFYRTGDACYLDPQGWLFFKGRLGEMIKTGGANVVPREIEVLLESQPEVRSAFVVGLPDAERGELVAAAVVLQDGKTVSEASLTARIKSELSSYKVPKKITFLRQDEVPFTDSGKIDKRRLTEQLMDRVTV